jgi:hypothetical protein
MKTEHKDFYKILFSPYAIKQTGIICNRCKLQINDYTLACAPYKLSKEIVEILISLDPREHSLFTNHNKRFCLLSFTFQDMYTQSYAETLMRGEIIKIDPLKDKASIYLIQLKLFNCPPDVSRLVDEYLKNYNSLQSNYEKFKDTFIYIDAENIDILPVNTISLIFNARVEKHILIYKFSTQKIVFLVHEENNCIPPDTEITLRFYCERCRFDVSGNVFSLKKYAPDALCMIMQIPFSPELTEMVSAYQKQIFEGMETLQAI